ncbi:Zeaxanthin epoxidase chloroplastic [Bienertia sinuspersici]
MSLNVERGLPVTRVISRMTLQQILAQAVGQDVIMNESNVVDFKDDGNKVTVMLESGQSYEGDLLVGADGIWSKVRKNLFGHTDAVYSGYTCYTGIADFVPADIETVGYRVFLGHKQYFVSSDVGGGKMQWYAFYKEDAGGVDLPSGKKQRLFEIFKGWCDNVIDLITATEEEAILRRDIYDRTPQFNWGQGRVTLLGDSIHAMQPNLGQGGCMAIEDSYELALKLDKEWYKSVKSGTPVDVVSSLRSYETARKLRVAVIHGLARMAAIMAATYKAYLGVGLGPLSASNQLQRWFEDDDALERALRGSKWYLLPLETDASRPICLKERKTSHVNRISERHAHIRYKDGAFFVTDLGSEHGTWITDNEGRRHRVPPNFPTRFHPSYVIEFGTDKRQCIGLSNDHTSNAAQIKPDAAVLQAA